jgi:hypothetical protein
MPESPLFDWLKKKPKLAPLSGVPAVRRQKSYSAQSGYVYQYFYEGYRPAGDAIEFVFDVCADRKTSFPVSVFVSKAATEAWEKSHRRELNGTERYAISKIALFAAFDERESPAKMHDAITVESASIEAILETLQID